MVFSQQSEEVETGDDTRTGEGDRIRKETPNGGCLHEFDDETSGEFWSLEIATSIKKVTNGGGGDVDNCNNPVAPICVSPQASSPADSTRNEVLHFSDTFPWLVQFSSHCSAQVGTSNILVLENLMTEFITLVEPVVKECYTKPNRAAKLKRCISGTLFFFHMHYSDIKKPLEHSSYLDKMSQLMAFFVDMEFKASCRAKESLPSVANKLISSLFLYLNRSLDHILDSILKTNFMTKSFRELSKMIFSRILRDSPGRTEETTYVRYILVYKMWKRVVHDVDEKKLVMKMAETKLSPPHAFREKLKAGFLNGVLPKIPKSRSSDITMFLMQAKFCPKEKADAFLKIVSDPERVSFTLLKINSRFTNDADNANSSDDLFEEEPNLLATSSSDESIEELQPSCSMLFLDSIIREKVMVVNVTKSLDKTKPKKNSTKKGAATPILMESPSQSHGNVLIEKKSRKRLVKKKDLSDKNEEVTQQPPASENIHEVKRLEMKDDEEVVQPTLPPSPSSPEPPPSPPPLPLVSSAQPVSEDPLPIEPVATIRIEVNSDESDKVEYSIKEEIKQEEATRIVDDRSKVLEEQSTETGGSENSDVKSSGEDALVDGDFCEPLEVTFLLKESSEELVGEREETHVRPESLLELQSDDETPPETPCTLSGKRAHAIYIKQVMFLQKMVEKKAAVTEELPLPVGNSNLGCNCNNCVKNLWILAQNYKKIQEVANYFKIGRIKSEAPTHKETYETRPPQLIGETSDVTEILSASAQVEDLSRQPLDVPPTMTTALPQPVSVQPDISGPEFVHDSTCRESIGETSDVTEILSASAQVEDLSRQRLNVLPTVTTALPPPLPQPVSVQPDRSDSELVHDSTFRRDISVHIKQMNLQKMFAEHTISPETELDCPYDAENNDPPRCACQECVQNFKALMDNHGKLHEAKIKFLSGDPDRRKTQQEVIHSNEPDEAMREDGRGNVESDEDLRLPLKKRRAMTSEPDQPPAKKQDIKQEENISYSLEQEENISPCLEQEENITSYLKQEENISSYLKQEENISSYLKQEENISSYLNQEENISSYLKQEEINPYFLKQEDRGERLTSYPSTPMLGLAELCAMGLRISPAAAYHLQSPGTSQTELPAQLRRPPPPPVYQRLPPSATFPASSHSPTPAILPPPPAISPSVPYRRVMTAGELKNYPPRNGLGENVDIEIKSAKPSKRKASSSKKRKGRRVNSEVF